MPSLWDYFLYQFYGIYKYDQNALDFIQTCKETQLSLCTVGKICPIFLYKSCTNSLPLGIQAAPLYSLIENIDFGALFLPICKMPTSLGIFLDVMSIFLPSQSLYCICIPPSFPVAAINIQSYRSGSDLLHWNSEIVMNLYIKFFQIH